MEIRLPQMPFKFETPDGLMEVTIRSRHTQGKAEEVYAAAAAFIGHGPRALERIQITPNAKSHTEVMKTLINGFKVNPASHGPETLDYRVLTALCSAQGVVEVDN